MQRLQVKAPEFMGALILALGALTAVGWVFEVRAIASLIPGSAKLGIVNPLLFIVVGMAMVAAARSALAGWRRAVMVLSATALVALPLGYIFENLSDVSLGIDIARASVQASAGNPHPGRISPNASLAFLAIGFAFGLLCLADTVRRRRAILGCCTVAALLGLTGLVGYFLGLDYLYRITRFNGMLPGTALGITLAAAGLWMLMQESLEAHPEGRSSALAIQSRSLAVIALVAVGAGVAGFGAMRETFEQSVSQGLLLTTSTNAKALGNAIDLGVRFSRTVASRPPLLKALDALSTTPNDVEAVAWLRAAAPTLLPLGSGGLQIYDANGTLLAQSGRLALSTAPLRYELAGNAPRATLAWQDGYLLATDINVMIDGRLVGRILIEQPLSFFNSILADLRASSDSADATIVGRRGDRALIAPSKAHATPSEPLLLDARAQPAQSKFKALSGQRGVDIQRDASGAAVMSAYVPIGAYGVGLAVDTEVASLYDPLRERLPVLALALASIVALGFYAQRHQVRPILRQLVASQQSLKAILEAQTELVSLARPDGRLAYVNPAYARQFASTPADMVGTDLFDHIEPADRDAVRHHFAGLMATGTPLHGENRMISADGRERWVAWVNSLEIDADGHPMIHSVGRDVTERKQAEQALQTAKAFLARTGRVAGVGGWEFDLSSGEITWSDETRRMHEVADDFVPTLQTAVGFYSPEARPTIEAAVAKAGADGTPWDLELPLVTAAGRAIWVRAQGEAEFEGGVLRRLVGAFQDITERRLLQERLADGERFVRKITDGLPVRIAYVDPELRYAFVNEAHCQRFGLPREKIVGRTRSELTGVPLDPTIRQRLESALAGHPQHFEFDEQIGDKAVRIENRMLPDIGSDGTVRGVFATGIDITERSRAERSLRELAAIFDNTPDFAVQANHRGEIVYMNPAVREAIGLTRDESLTGRSFAEFNTPETNRRFAEEIQPAVKAHGVWLGQTTVKVRANPSLPVSHMVIAHRDEQGRVSRYSSIMRDVSAAVAAAEEASRQAATLHSISEAIPAIVAVVGLNGRYRFVNGAFARWYGAPRESVVGRSVMEVLGLKEYERSRPFIERALSGETVSFEKSYDEGGIDRHLAISYIPLQPEGGGVDGFVGVAQDITQHKREQLRLVKLSQQDSLTGLLNRAGFEHFLDEHAQAPRRSGDGDVAVLYIDLDHFKPVNDTHGHAIGDLLLQAFAKRLHRAVRPSDAVVRLGGDEFAIALLGVREAANANVVAEKVVSAACDPFLIGGLTLRIGASIGVGFGLDPDRGWRELVERADARLYEAKAAGRGQYASTR